MTVAGQTSGCSQIGCKTVWPLGRSLGFAEDGFASLAIWQGDIHPDTVFQGESPSAIGIAGTPPGHGIPDALSAA